MSHQYNGNFVESHHDEKGVDMAMKHDMERDGDSEIQQDVETARGDNEAISELYIWGNDYYGQLGVGCEKIVHNFPKICSFNIVVSDVSCGEEHTVFVQGDGGFVYAMGNNNEGRLGTGNPETRICNVPTLVDGICNIRKVACGSAHTLALGEDGTVFSWGQAFYGALGLTFRDQDNVPNKSPKHQSFSQYSPVMIPQEVFDNKGVKDIEAGSRHSIFVTEDNKVYGCGDANQGQLGLGFNFRDRVMEPTCIQSIACNTIKAVACGKYHTLILVDSQQNQRELWAFGANNFGQVGNNSNQNQFLPVRIDPRAQDERKLREKSHNFKQISAWNSSAAVTEEGTMYVWGSGIFGEFKKPRKVKLQNNIQINNVQVGGSFLVIVDSDFKVIVWGSNSNGEIGVGDGKVRNHPTRLETIEDKVITKISVGSSFAFAIGATKSENTIFDESISKSHISALKNGQSQIGDPNEFEDMKHQMNHIQMHSKERVNKSAQNYNNNAIKGLEEQLKQISIGTPTKESQVPQDRSAGKNTNRQEVWQNKQADREQVAQLHQQLQVLKEIVEEREQQIQQMQIQQNSKHEEYKQKLDKFKEIQDQELKLAKQLREENKLLREQNTRLQDEILELKKERNNKLINQKYQQFEPAKPQNNTDLKQQQQQIQAPTRTSIEFSNENRSPIPERAKSPLNIDDLKYRTYEINQQRQNNTKIQDRVESADFDKRRQDFEEVGKKFDEATRRVYDFKRNDSQNLALSQNQNTSKGYPITYSKPRVENSQYDMSDKKPIHSSDTAVPFEKFKSIDEDRRSNYVGQDSGNVKIREENTLVNKYKENGTEGFRSDFARHDLNQQQTYQQLSEKRLIGSRVEQLRHSQSSNGKLQEEDPSEQRNSDTTYKFANFHKYKEVVERSNQRNHEIKKDDETSQTRMTSFAQISSKPPIPHSGIQNPNRHSYDKSPDKAMKRALTPTAEDMSSEAHFRNVGQINSLSQQRLSHNNLNPYSRSLNQQSESDQNKDKPPKMRNEFRSKFDEINNIQGNQTNSFSQVGEQKYQQQEKPQRQAYSSNVSHTRLQSGENSFEQIPASKLYEQYLANKSKTNSTSFADGPQAQNSMQLQGNMDSIAKQQTYEKERNENNRTWTGSIGAKLSSDCDVTGALNKNSFMARDAEKNNSDNRVLSLHEQRHSSEERPPTSMSMGAVNHPLEQSQFNFQDKYSKSPNMMTRPASSGIENKVSNFSNSYVGNGLGSRPTNVDFKTMDQYYQQNETNRKYMQTGESQDFKMDRLASGYSNNDQFKLSQYRNDSENTEQKTNFNERIKVSQLYDNEEKSEGYIGGRRESYECNPREPQINTNQISPRPNSSHFPSDFEANKATRFVERNNTFGNPPNFSYPTSQSLLANGQGYKSSYEMSGNRDTLIKDSHGNNDFGSILPSAANPHLNNYLKSSQHDSAKKSNQGSYSGQPMQRNEDIKSKLARYKQERENFEVIRQQFRQKHKEIQDRSDVSNSQIRNSFPKDGELGTASTQNGDFNISSQFGKYGSLHEANMSSVGDSAHSKGHFSSNIFMIDQQPGAQNQALKGSPAFGDDQQASTDQPNLTE